MPRWESVPPEKIEGYRRPGRRLEVDVGLRPDASSPAPGRVVGAYGGFNGEDLVLVTYGETRVIPRRELHDVRVRTGSAWALGLVFGAVADVAFIAAAIVFVATYQPAISIGRW